MFYESIEDDTNVDMDLEFVAIKKKKARVRKSTAGKRTIQREWNDEEIVRLIAAVKKRRQLWDLASPEYKLPKTDSWIEVFFLYYCPTSNEITI